MDEPGKEDIYIKKKTNNNYCTIFFYLYNIKYISFYAFYVLHFTFRRCCVRTGKIFFLVLKKSAKNLEMSQKITNFAP